MAKLEGIIYKTFDHYVVLRGFAPIKDLAAISHKPDSYQRNALDNHKKEIVEFLKNQILFKLSKLFFQPTMHLAR